MKNCLILLVATLVAAGAAFGALGTIVGSFRVNTSGSNGLAIVSSTLYCSAPSVIIRRNTTTGSVYGTFAKADGSVYGLAFQAGIYLWQAKGNTSPRLYRTNANNGSIFNSYSTISTTCTGAAPLATGDGGMGTTRILVSDWSHHTIYYYRLTGGYDRSHSVGPPLWDIAYDWRNELIWGGYNARTVYGFNTNGSLCATFNLPSNVTTIRGITYSGQYLWVAGYQDFPSGYIYRVHCPRNLDVRPESIGKIKAMFD